MPSSSLSIKPTNGATGGGDYQSSGLREQTHCHPRDHYKQQFKLDQSRWNIGIFTVRAIF